MFDEFLGHLQALSRVDTLIARISLQVLARRFASFAFAGLIAVFGLGMADLAGFYQLQTTLGPVWAAALVALADFFVAAIVAFGARSIKPGPEIEIAMDVRKMAIKSLQHDARVLEQQIRDAKHSITSLVSSPLDAAAQKLLIPAVLALLKGIRARRGKVEQTGSG
jgi:hypothetical protein